jgi:hypothetical protein
MFGLPFFTSLIVTVALVVAFSFVINKGSTKKKADLQESITGSKEKAQTGGHA